MKSESKKHVGHRQRLRNKVKSSGLKVLSKHEIMELLLTYTIPRKDTNDFGHNLIERYGSISKVLSADVVDLKKIEGIGESSAFFLNLIGQLFEIVKAEKGTKIHSIKNTGDMVRHYRQNYLIEDIEKFTCFVFSEMGKVESVFGFDGGSATNVEIDKKTFIDNINIKKSSAIIVVHTHPDGDVQPSRADIIATQQLLSISSLLGIAFNDHIIINEKSYYSFKEHGLLDDMKVRYGKLFSNDFHILSKNNGQDEDDSVYF